MIYYTSLFFFFLFFFQICALPTRTITLFPLPSVECVSKYRHWTPSGATCFCRQSLLVLFCFFQPSPQLVMLSAWHSGGRSQSSQKLHWWKLRVLFVCQLCHSVLSTLPFQQWRDFFFFFFCPCSPGAMSTDAIWYGHANFVIGKTASQP